LQQHGENDLLYMQNLNDELDGPPTEGNYYEVRPQQDHYSETYSSMLSYI